MAAASPKRAAFGLVDPKPATEEVSSPCWMYESPSSSNVYADALVLSVRTSLFLKKAALSKPLECLLPVIALPCCFQIPVVGSFLKAKRLLVACAKMVLLGPT